MIRRPSTEDDLFRWWRHAVLGAAQPNHGEPQCGFYKTRLVKGGPWVPVRIWCEQEIDPETGELTAPEILRCECDGQRRDPWLIWTYLTPISRAHWDALNEARAKNLAMQATLARVNLSTLPPVRPPK